MLHWTFSAKIRNILRSYHEYLRIQTKNFIKAQVQVNEWETFKHVVIIPNFLFFNTQTSDLISYSFLLLRNLLQRRKKLFAVVWDCSMIKGIKWLWNFIHAGNSNVISTQWMFANDNGVGYFWLVCDKVYTTTRQSSNLA